MRGLRTIGSLLLGAIACGCTDRQVVGTDDVIPPGEPQEVYSVTGDGEVTLYWSPPGDVDLAGFSVSISQDDVDYYRLGDVGASRRHFVVSGDVMPSSVPFDFVNGSTYFLGVTAFDTAGNESALTVRSTTFDTPRPSGLGLRLYRADGAMASASGYDFSRSPYGYAGSANSLFTDIYFIWENGQPLMRTPYPAVVEMEDKGSFDFDDPAVGWLDPTQWNPTDSVVLRPGHVVLVKIFEESRPGNTVEPYNVAKFQVFGLDSESVVIDWAYQIDPNNPELKPTPAGPAARRVPNREVQG